ncbi:MAG: type I restriction endonuclease subunit R [Planctomycetota bacterium]|nr:MAG: type I restriction endonuclease subunit R [Planctomycetota bacterium]
MPNEQTFVEDRLLAQLAGFRELAWQQVAGRADGQYQLLGRRDYRQVLLPDILRESLRRINPGPDGQPWLDEPRLAQALARLERLPPGALLEVNQTITELLLAGTEVDGAADWLGGRDQRIDYIDFTHPERNDFRAINQFRVDGPGASGNRGFIVPDVVLFVNGIPLVVIECKSPNRTDPIEEAVNQLRRYSNQREDVEQQEGAERLFHFAQVLVATSFYQAKAGTISSTVSHYQSWRDTAPLPTALVAAELGGKERLEEQEMLCAGLLRPEHFLDIMQNFVLCMNLPTGKRIKALCRYQQFRAVRAAVSRLSSGQTRRQHAQADQRGGIVWHTQGSGKSLTMVFLIRKLRTMAALRRFKVVVITDRTQLQEQLAETAELSGEVVEVPKTSAAVKRALSAPGAGLVFAMIQKYQEREGEAPPPLRLPTRTGPPTPQAAEADPVAQAVAGSTFSLLNDSEDILVLVDEAHRSQSSALHANLLQALPNCARIGFTGTPILMGERKRTHEIFGDFIDRYTIKESERDGATVPILYEGRDSQAFIEGAESLDQLFDDGFSSYSDAEREAIKARHANQTAVLEAEELIRAKAADLVRHYISCILPGGFKAQVVAVSRLAAVRYQQAISAELLRLRERLDALDERVQDLDDESLASHDEETQFLVRAWRQRAVISGLQAAAVISGQENERDRFGDWWEPAKVKQHTERFTKPLTSDSLAFLCVKSMLLTGFDAPIEQVLYLDRFMQGHELLQTIARTNRTYAGKHCGIIVDYVGLARRLKEALAVYAEEDIDGALADLRDELPLLRDRDHAVCEVLAKIGITDLTPSIATVEKAVEALRPERERAAFTIRLKQFLSTLDTVLPRPEALPYVPHAKLFGFIANAAKNRYRDTRVNISGAGEKVRALIDQHLKTHGINPILPPIAITDAQFASEVDKAGTRRAAASEMEHAARHHIEVHFDEDPARYSKLSEKLASILDHFHDNWEEQIEALQQLISDIRNSEGAGPAGLPETHGPFFGLLNQHLPGTDHQILCAATVELVEHIRQELATTAFWDTLSYQHALRTWLIDSIDRMNLEPQGNLGKIEHLADLLMELARHNHHKLIRP